MLASPYLIEDIDQATDESRLLHWFNATREQGCSLLMSSGVPLSSLPFTLPDLTSRLLAIPCAAIAEPDEAIIAAALRKQFADRQMHIDDEVIAYLLARMERSFPAAHQWVQRLDKATLEQGKAITIPLVRQLLGGAASLEG